MRPFAKPYKRRTSDIRSAGSLIAHGKLLLSASCVVIIALSISPVFDSISGASSSTLGASCVTAGATIGGGPGVTLVCVKVKGKLIWQRQGAPSNYVLGRYSLNPVTKGQALANGICSGSGVRPLTHAPMDPSDIGVIQPLGDMVFNHVIPVDHEYYYATNPNASINTYPVYATASGTIDAVGADFHNGPSTLPAWSVTLSHSCTFFSQYNLLTSLSSTVQAALPKGWSSTNSGGVRIPVSAGEIIGYDGGQSLDFSVVNTAVTNPGYLSPVAYDNFDPQYVNTVAPFGYFDANVQSQIGPKYVRSATPIDGQIGYDVKGEAVGNWFVAGSANVNKGVVNPNASQEGFLSLSYNYVDPTALMVSIDEYQGQPTQFIVTNSVDWTKITPSSGVAVVALAPSSFEPEWTGTTLVAGLKLVAAGSDVATALIQMTGPEDLKFQIFPGMTPEQVTGFSASAVLYDRGQHAVELKSSSSASNG